MKMIGRFSIFEKLRAQAKKAPNSKLQAPKKHQAPSSKTDRRAVCPGICLRGLVFEIWNFSGAWGLGLGVSLSGGPKTEMRSQDDPAKPRRNFWRLTCGLELHI